MCVMSPPLTITREQIDEMVSILRKGIEMAVAEIETLESIPVGSTQHHPSPAA
jgi:hypothetical protein